MGNTEWYLGTDWDERTQNNFEEKLRKARGPYNKAQYLLIKGGCLLRSGDPFKEMEGQKLLGRVIVDYKDQVPQVMFSYEQLGDYFFSKNDLTNAEKYYRLSISYYSTNGRSGSSGIGDIKLAETLFLLGKSEALNEAYFLLTENFERTDGRLLLNDDKFRYYRVLAKIAYALNKMDEAREYAIKAIDLTKTEPQLDTYPKLGVIRIDEKELELLRKISETR